MTSKLTNFSFLLLFLFSFTIGTSQQTNLYQTCTLAGSQSVYGPVGGIPFGLGSIAPDAGNSALPPSEYYSTTLDDGSTVYFNICAGSTICEGGVACVVAKDGTKDIWAYPNSSSVLSYYVNRDVYPRVNVFVITYKARLPKFRSVEINIICNNFNQYPTNATVSGNMLTINTESYDVCYDAGGSFFGENPYTSSSLVAPIYLAGQLPMFSMDLVTSRNRDTTFVGTLYYSEDENSFKMEGTLSNEKGDTSDVSYLFSGNQPDGSPPIMASTVNIRGHKEPVCVLHSFPAGSDDTDQIVNWFDQSVQQDKNTFESMGRNYTSVYFEKGSTIPVRVYTQEYADTAVSLMLFDQSPEFPPDVPVYVGTRQIAPFLPKYQETPRMISEIDWRRNTLSVEFLAGDSGIFDVPASCNKDDI